MTRLIGILAMFGGVMTSSVFVVLYLADVIDWAPIWIALPVLIDIALWAGTVRSLVVADHVLSKAIRESGFREKMDDLNKKNDDMLAAMGARRGSKDDPP